MSNIQDTNYALISALYASGTGGLYSDVYFPIIKYTIVQLFNQRLITESTHYYTAQDVHDFIQERFKIHIPNIVLTKSLQKIDETKKNFVELTLMENGNSFQIKKVWDSHEFDEIATRESYFTEGLKNIEADYKLFLEQNGCYDDGVSYIQFISDNTEEVLGYFQNNDVSVIDEKYATIIFFLEYLNNTPTKNDEFIIADQLFWASIIAGYLRSEKPPVDAAEDGSKKEYFLDTSILLGMLGLSAKQKEEYSDDIKNIIQSSGGIMRVHPMTLEEIKTILSSVESATIPDPGTDIAEAWFNHKLSITKLASIRLSLQSRLSKLGVQMFPILGVDECKRKASAYKGKKIVEELARERSKSPKSYSQDNFREIHDLFMDDYIKERRKEKNGSEDIVFVTANRDLISFTKQCHPDANYMISTGRIILDLWMHNVKPADISSCALTETMARCLDQHNLRVRSKIIEVSKFYNENKGNFNADVYQDFIKKLYKRARNVIITVESNPDNQDALDEDIAQRIIDAVKADQEYYDKRIGVSESRNAELEYQLDKEVEEKVALAKAHIKHEEQIDLLRKKNDDLTGQVRAAKDAIANTLKKVEEEKEGRGVAEETVSLFKEKDQLNKELEKVIIDIAPLEHKRDKAFKNIAPKWLFGIGLLLLFVVATIAYVAIIKRNYSIIAIGAILVPLAVFLFNRACSLNDKKEEREKDAIKRWENKDENRLYLDLIEKKQRITDRLTEIEITLKQR